MIILILTLCAFSFSSFGSDDYVVRVEEISKTGKTIIISRGKYDGIKEGEFAYLLATDEIIDRKTSRKRKLHRPAAKIRSVKVHSNRSFWVIFKVFSRKTLVKNAKLLLLSESSMLRGRGGLTFEKTKLVSNKKSVKKDLKDYLLEDIDLANKSEDHIVIDRPHSKKKFLDSDINQIDLATWESKYSDRKKFPMGIYQSPQAKDFSRRVRLSQLDKSVVAYIQKFNDPDFSRKKFYKEQMRSSQGLLPDRSVYGSAYSRNIKNKARVDAIRDKFYEDVKEKGQNWSDDYSDQQLSEVLNEMGTRQEIIRRKVLAGYRYNYQLGASAGLNLADNENVSDGENSQKNKFDFEVAIEGFVFKSFPSLKNITLQFSVRRAQDGFKGSSLNVLSTDYSFATHINWYPFQAPNSVNTNIFYVGAHLRFGLARLRIDSTDEVGNYTISSFPGFRTGMKYNFENGYGIKVFSTIENVVADRQVKSADEGNLPDRLSYLEAKIAIGLMKFY